ncbi:MAG TPA: hypothetical protein VMP08_08915 [Anaerolineae bacterium]|nr:hypothetical protein [Anaerolineae bacterium]
MTHPLSAIPADKRTRVFVPLLIAALVMTFLFRFIGPAQPTIVDFELAGIVEKAQSITDAWNPTDRIRAGFSLGFDYLYMPLYSTMIALACVMAAGVLKKKAWYSIGILLAWGLWAAALCDATENLALFTELLGNNVAPWPSVAQLCATIKFGLIALGLLYVSGGVVLRFVRK